MERCRTAAAAKGGGYFFLRNSITVFLPLSLWPRTARKSARAAEMTMKAMIAKAMRVRPDMMAPEEPP
jgi:hypothetical protein